MNKSRSAIAGMPSGVGVGRCINGHGTAFWRVRLGKKFTGGQSVLRDFHTLSEARDWIAEQSKQRRETGVGTFTLTPKQLGEAADAFRRLKGESLSEAVSFFLKHARPLGGTRTFAEVCEEFLQSRRAMGVRPRTLVQYESYLRILRDQFGETDIAQITRAEIEEFLSESDWGTRTRLNYLVTLSTILGFARDRDYCPVNPADRVARPIIEERPVGILSVQQAAGLLAAARRSNPRLVPGLAISLLAGIRRSELAVLDWSEVSLTKGVIEIRGSKAKTRQRRAVRICDALREWLVPVEQSQGPVAVSRREDVMGEQLRELVAVAGIGAYPHNGLRHSFGSYHLELHRNEQLTASEMGNSPGVIFRHYRSLVSGDDARRYFELTPAGAEQRAGGPLEPIGPEVDLWFSCGRDAALSRSA
jgi:integrase